MKNGKKYLPENYINCSFVTPTEIQLCTLVKLQLRAAQDQFKGHSGLFTKFALYLHLHTSFYTLQNYF